MVRKEQEPARCMDTWHVMCICCDVSVRKRASECVRVIQRVSTSIRLHKTQKGCVAAASFLFYVRLLLLVCTRQGVRHTSMTCNLINALKRILLAHTRNHTYIRAYARMYSGAEVRVYIGCPCLHIAFNTRPSVLCSCLDFLGSSKRA